MTLIGLISDVHASPGPLAEALSIFDKAGVDQVLCAGDVAGYMDELEHTVRLLIDNNCQTIMGNHDLLYLDHHEDETDNPVNTFLKQLPAAYQADIEGKHLYMVHAQPPDGCHGGIKLLDKAGKIMPEKIQQWRQKLQPYEYDVLVVGHTHQVYVENIADMLVINPGSTVFNHCCAILRLPDMTVDLYALSGKDILRTWNWGEHVIYKK